MADTDLKEKWKEFARNEQQEMCNFFSEVDWDMYPHDQLDVLKRKVEYLLFGPSLEIEVLGKQKMTEEEEEKEVQEAKKKHEEEKKRREETLENICRVIVEEGTKNLPSDSEIKKKNAYMVFIFVYWKDEDGNEGCWPVFRVPKDDTGSTASFIDLNCRVYCDWKDFLENNQFPPCDYCYPMDGKYQCTSKGSVIVEYGTSPAGSTSKKLLTALDITSTGVAAVGTIVTLASLAFPVAAPLMVATSAAMGGVSGYSIFRSSTTLYDRKTHKQDIGFLDREARGCYISILASTVGFGATAATSATVRMAQNGQVMGRLATAGVTALNGSALVMNGVGVINSLHHLIEKHKEGELTAFDVAQFSASLLLFCHSTVNFKTAQTIIENTQDQVINDFKNDLRSNRHRKIFDKGLKNTVREHGNTDGKALTIRSIKHIDNVDDFFASMVRTDKQVRYVKGSKMSFAEGGKVLINNKLDLDPRQFAALNKEQRVTVLRAAQRYNMNRMSAAKFNDITNNLLKDVPMAPKSSISHLEVPGVGFKPNETPAKTIMSYLSGLLSVSQLEELNDILKLFSNQFQSIILQLSIYLFKKMNNSSGNQYIDIIHFVCKFVEHLMFYIVDGHRKYILAALRDRIRCVPSENMSNVEYCLAILEQLLLDPTLMFDIFQNIKYFFELLQEGFHIREYERRVNFLELVSVASTLLQLEKPLWPKVIDCARMTLHSLGYHNFSSLIAVVKDLCLYIEKVVLDMEERYETFRQTKHDTNDVSQDVSKDYKTYCAMAVESLNDQDVAQSLNVQICENNKDIFTSEKSSTRNLVLKRNFWEEDPDNLLTEKEIIEVCKQALKTDNILTNYVIESEGLQYFVIMKDKQITLKCDLEANLLTVHVDFNACTEISKTEADSVVNKDFSKIPEENSNFKYTVEHPLILEKHTWFNGEKKLLTQKEICLVCKKTLNINNFPQEYTVDYDDLKILVAVEGKTVVIECDVEASRLCAYVSPLKLTSVQNSNASISDEGLLGNGQCYTEKVPFVTTKCFDYSCGSELLSEDEILNICQGTLNAQYLPQDCTIEFHGQKILVGVEDKVIVLKCDVESDKIYSYVDCAAELSTVTEKLECSTVSHTGNPNFYTRENPLVLNKNFDDEKLCELLTEDEIMSICQKILCETDASLLEASFEYYGTNIFVYLNEKTITIECDTCNGSIHAFIQNVNISS